jgi:hypothetical protein
LKQIGPRSQMASAGKRRHARMNVSSLSEAHRAFHADKFWVENVYKIRLGALRDAKFPVPCLGTVYLGLQPPSSSQVEVSRPTGLEQRQRDD